MWLTSLVVQKADYVITKITVGIHSTGEFGAQGARTYNKQVL